jgi:uncharacterized protein (DUF4415 family)
MTIKNKPIKYGKVELDADEFDPKHCKVRVTMMIDEDIVKACRAEAAKRHVGYQTLINQKLREIYFDEKSVEKRLETLEALVLKKRASGE